MGSLLCLGQSAVCGACGNIESNRLFARIGYVILSLLCVALSLFVLFFGGRYISYIGYFIDCDSDKSTMEVCISVSAVYRMSFSLCAFHMLFFLLCLCGGPVIAGINSGVWLLKLLLIIGVYALSFLLSNAFFRYYAYFGIVLGALFVAYEMILLIDLAYSWNKSWIDSYDSSVGGTQTCWAIIIVITSLVLLGCSAAIFVFLYRNFTENWEIAITTGTIVAGLIFTGISISPLVDRGSLLTCSFVLLFTAFLCFSALLSQPKETGTGVMTAQLAIGLGFVFMTLFYVSGSTQSESVAKGEDKSRQVIARAGSPVMEKADAAVGYKVQRSDEGESQQQQTETEMPMSTALFHLLMAFAAVYYSMLLTNWGEPNIKGTIFTYFSSPGLGLGVKLTAQGLVTLLYIWSMIAPRVLPDRDFN